MSTHATVIENESTAGVILEDEPADVTDAADFQRRIARTERRRIDVTDLDAAGLEEFVEENVGTHLVSLEHRAGRTYLVLE
ncbi:hypothetical protein [Halovivax sp.]|uniref:hypothetical protein n=1 Tax=Halovivax sp. TaxID=1935978 RepID=UPI0025C4EB8E|nr:hypothetical protein [Halovivax sp.]